MILKRMRSAPGNQRASSLFNNAGDGTVEVVVLSVWNSMEDIKAFAGPNYLQPTIPPSHVGRVFRQGTCIPSLCDERDSALTSRLDLVLIR